MQLLHLKSTEYFFSYLSYKIFPFEFKNNDITPFGDQAEITAQTNFFGTINICNALFPLLRDHARFVH